MEYVRLDELSVCLEGETRTLAQWTELFVQTHYPNLGQRCYRVPPVHFNQQDMTPDLDTGAMVLKIMNDGVWRGDQGHSLVLDNLECLGRHLEKEGDPPFIIGGFHFDNYLARIKLPPDRQTKGKGEEKRQEKEEGHGQGKGQGKEEGKQKAEGKTKGMGKAKGRRRTEGNADMKGQVNSAWTRQCKGRTEGNADRKGQVNSAWTGQCKGRAEGNADRKGQVNSAWTGLWKVMGKGEGKAEEKGRGKAEGMGQGRTVGKGEGKAEGKEEGKGEEKGGEKAEGKGEEKGEGKGVEKADEKGEEKAEGEGVEKAEGKGEDKAEGKTEEKGERKTERLGEEKVERRGERKTEGKEDRKTENGESGNRDGGRLPPRPRDLNQRGEIDIVFLSQMLGVVLIEAKATTGWKSCSENELLGAIRDRVLKAVNVQLKRACDMFHYIMPDLSLADLVHRVVAFPMLPRSQVNMALTGLTVDSDVVFLTKDDNSPSAIYHWWSTNFTQNRLKVSLDMADMKKIVGRLCGLLSIVPVWTMKGRPRVEVRTSAQAISLTADRYSDIILLPSQSSVLADRSPHACITGPVGSGKTLLLQLKGRQWLQEGHRVVVLNTRTTARGRAIGHVLEESIKRGEDSWSSGGSVEKHDLAMCDFHIDKFREQLEERGPTGRVCFLLDELSTHRLKDLIMPLIDALPACPIWFSSLAVTDCPAGFQLFRLDTSLRCPPSVQRLLKVLDKNPFHQNTYVTHSAARGLPCDGPPVLCIEHQKHEASSGRPLCCSQCADDLLDIMKHTLGLPVGSQQQGQSEETPPTTTEDGKDPGISSTRPGKKHTEQATSLTFGDVLIAICVPLPCYKRLKNGHWKSSFADVMRFLKFTNHSRFLLRLKEHGVPLRLVIDSTSPDIARPSRDEVILTDIMALASLERKVMVFIPGGPALDETEVDSTYINALLVSLCDRPGEDPRSEEVIGDEVAERQSRRQETAAEVAGREPLQQTPRTLSDGTDLEDLNRLLTPSRPSQTAFPSKEQAWNILLKAFGNTMVADTNGTVPLFLSDEMLTPAAELGDGSGRLRIGMELRGDSPRLKAATPAAGRPSGPAAASHGAYEQGECAPPSGDSHAAASQQEHHDHSTQNPCGLSSQTTHDHSNTQTTDNNATTHQVSTQITSDGVTTQTTPDHDTALDHSPKPTACDQNLPEDLADLLLVMLEDDRDSLFMAASRCLSQLIVVNPGQATAAQAGH